MIIILWTCIGVLMPGLHADTKKVVVVVVVHQEGQGRKARVLNKIYICAYVECMHWIRCLVAISYSKSPMMPAMKAKDTLMD